MKLSTRKYTRRARAALRIWEYCTVCGQDYGGARTGTGKPESGNKHSGNPLRGACQVSGTAVDMHAGGSGRRPEGNSTGHPLRTPKVSVNQHLGSTPDGQFTESSGSFPALPSAEYGARNLPALRPGIVSAR